MKKLPLLPALTIAVIAAAGLSLPATAAADPARHETTKVVVRGDHPRDAYFRPVHEVRRDSHNHGRSKWISPRYQHDRGHHYGHQNRYVQRHEYRPMVRYEPRYDYRPVERYESRHDGDVRVRISYDLHL